MKIFFFELKHQNANWIMIFKSITIYSAGEKNIYIIKTARFISN